MKKPKNKRKKAARKSFDRGIEFTAEESDFKGRLSFTGSDLALPMQTIRGMKIFKCFKLAKPDQLDQPIKWLPIFLPVAKNELAEKNNIHVLLVVPYFSEVPVSDMVGRSGTRVIGVIQDGICYETTRGTLSQYKKALEYLGLGYDSREEYLEELFKASTCENGYYEQFRIYWLNNKVYHEGDVIWCDFFTELLGDFEQNNILSQNPAYLPYVSVDFNAIDIHACPMDVTRAKNITVENFRRKLSNEELFEAKLLGINIDELSKLTIAEKVWYLAKKRAEKEGTIGFAIVCIGGEFYVPVESWYDFDTDSFEYYLTIFNAIKCNSNRHDCAAIVAIDVGDAHIETPIRPKTGRYIDWQLRINEAITIIKNMRSADDSNGQGYSE